MGGPRAPNPIKTIADSYSDIGKGIKQLSDGGADRFRGLETIALGGANMLTMGTSRTLGILPPGATEREREATLLSDQQTADATAQANADINARKERVRLRLDQEIKARMRTPGRAATLLTPTLIPNEANSQTLLTGMGGNNGR